MTERMRDLSQVLREGMYLQQKVLDVLKGGPKTIPEIAQTLHRPSREVMLWVMMLRRYGRVADVPKGPADEYFRYRAMEGGR